MWERWRFLCDTCILIFVFVWFSLMWFGISFVWIWSPKWYVDLALTFFVLIFDFWFFFLVEMQLNLVNNTKLPTVDTTMWRLSGWVFKKIKVWFWEFFFFFIRKKLRSRHLFYYFLRENKTRNKTFSFLFDWLNG